MFAMPLSQPSGSASVGAEILDKVPLAPGVERQWFYSEAPALPNRREPPEGWRQLFRSIQDNPVGGMEFRPPDVFKAWNSAFAGDPCKHPFLRHAPGVLYMYDPVDGAATPPYRYVPNVTLPNGLVTNQMGWRGPPIEEPRAAKTIRIVFVGSSTTMAPAHLPFSYPELIGYWLNRWAAARKLPVNFEVLNTGRESIVSTDSAAVVRTEVVPLRPDLVIYYEGGNQFRPQSVFPRLVNKDLPKPPTPTDVEAPSWLQVAAKYSALVARIRAAIGIASSTVDGREPAKPDYELVWPAGLSETDPDLAYPNLPVTLNTIQRDLDQMRTDLAKVGSDFAVSSFLWMVKDGLMLDPVRHRYIYEQLNSGNYPFRYRDMERLSNFQNRFLEKYAKVHGLPFIDFAKYVPLDPDLFTDAVHTNYAGLRLQAWAGFNLLLPVVEKHLADKSWPRPVDPAAPKMPTIAPRRITFACQ